MHSAPWNTYSAPWLGGAPFPAGLFQGEGQAPQKAIYGRFPHKLGTTGLPLPPPLNFLKIDRRRTSQQWTPSPLWWHRSCDGRDPRCLWMEKTRKRILNPSTLSTCFQSALLSSLSFHNCEPQVWSSLLSINSNDWMRNQLDDRRTRPRNQPGVGLPARWPGWQQRRKRRCLFWFILFYYHCIIIIVLFYYLLLF